MELYIRRDNKEISLEEWYAYIALDGELEKVEMQEGIHPITRQKMKICIPGHVVYKLNGEVEGELFYREGILESEDTEEAFIAKAGLIAAGLDADLYVDDEKVN